MVNGGGPPGYSGTSFGSVARQADAHPHEARRDGLLFTAGVVLSFVGAAVALVALREGGQAAGWGMQLQSPIVVTILAYVLFLVGLNLSGFFEIDGGTMGGAMGIPLLGAWLGMGETNIAAFVSIFVSLSVIGVLGLSLGLISQKENPGIESPVIIQ